MDTLRSCTTSDRVVPHALRHDMELPRAEDDLVAALLLDAEPAR